MAEAQPVFDAVPDVQFDAVPDPVSTFDAVPDETALAEAQRATVGAVQALDVMGAPRQFDWSEVNAQMDAERFQEAEALRAEIAGKVSTPERRAMFAQSQQKLADITPFTPTGQYLAQQRAGEAEAAADVQATAERGTTPSGVLTSMLGPGLSTSLVPIAESAGRNVGAAAGGAIGAAAFMPGPPAIVSRASTILANLFPIFGAVGGSIAGGAGQEAVMQIGETPEETQARQQRAAEDFARNPGLSRIGASVANVPFFGPSLAQFGRAMAGDKGAIVNLGLAGTIGGAMEVGSAMLQGRPVEAADVAAGVFSNLIMNEPTKLGRKLGLLPSTEQAQAEAAASAQDGQVRIPMGLPEADSGLMTRGTTSDADVFAGVPRRPADVPPETPAPAPTPQEIVPAIKIGDQLVKGNPGDTHQAILDRHMEANPDDIDAVVNFDTKANPNLFVDAQGNEFSRADLKDRFGVSDSQGLRALQEASVPEVSAKQESTAKKEVVDEIVEELAEYTNKDSVSAVKKIVTELTEKFEVPGVVARLNFAGKTKSSGEVFGVYEPSEGGERRTGKSEMAFQDYVFRFTPDEVERVFQDWSRRTGTVKGGTRALVAHEFGHVLHNLIRHNRTDADLTRIHETLKSLESELGSPSEYARKSVSEWLPERLALEDSEGGGKLTDFLKAEIRTVRGTSAPAAEPAPPVTPEAAVPPTPEAPPVPPAEPPVTPPAAEAPLLGPDPTSNKEAVVNAERAQRGLDPVIKEAAIENPIAIDYAERAIEANPDRPQRIVDRLRTNPMERTISVEDAAILLIERTKLRSRRDAAAARLSRKEGSPMDRAIAEAEFIAAEGQLNQMDQAAQDARSTWGRFGQLWQRSMREDFSLTNLERRARMSKDGPLDAADLSKLEAISAKAEKAHQDFDIRQKQVELENRQKEIESNIQEVRAKLAPTDPAVKNLADRIIARLDVASKNAEKSLRSRLANLGSAPDPLIVLDVAKMAAARVAKASIEFGQWSAEMVSKFGEKVRPFLQAGWDQREQVLDASINSTAGSKKKEVAARVKKTAVLTDAQQIARIDAAIGNRVKEGKPISALAPYVNKLQEQFIKQGITEREALIDAVHGSLKKHDPAITRDDAMEVMSKYGSDYATTLSRDPVKMTRRELDGQIQQILKLRDISAKVPLPKSGPERPTPGPVWRSLIKQVNAAKKKLGVVVTDPESQLKSSQDAIRTRMRNDIEDMTLELETGVRPPERAPTEYAQDMEILKGVRDRVRETLRQIDENPQLQEEQRIALAKRSAEESLAMWERRLAGEEAKAPKQRVSTPEIEAIRARRDAAKAQVEEIDAMDAVLQENRKAEALVRSIKQVEAEIAAGAPSVAKVQGPETQLVAEAQKQLADLRAALDTQRANDPKRQVEAIEKAELALEAAIKKLDGQLQAGDISVQTRRSGPQSERIEYLTAQRNAMNRLRQQLRNEARPRLSADELAIKTKTAQMLRRAADLRQRIATGDFGPRTRKPPTDISSDKKALDAQADLLAVESDFLKMQEQWKLDQLTLPQQVLRRIGQAWDATANMFLSFDLSTPLQTAFAMASRPLEGAAAIGKGATAFYQQFVKGSDEYARREAARIANSINSKNGIYKAMKLELPSALGKKREENMSSVLEQLADLDARWAGIPDVVRGLFKMEGRTLLKGAKRLALVAPVFLGRGIKASNAGFETIANTMRARTADAMLNRWYGRGRGTPTKQQLELLGEQINIATGKGGLQAGDSVRRLLFAPNYYLSILKQLSGWQLGKAAVRLEGQVAKDIASEYIRAVATMGTVYGLAYLFGDRDRMTTDLRDKNAGKLMTDKGTSIDLTMGRGAWLNAAVQIYKGERVIKGKVKKADRKGTLLTFAGGRLSRGVSSALTSAFGEDFKGDPISGIEVAKDFVVPLGWRDFDDLLKREGFTRGSFIQLLNILGVTHKIAE